jgi:hypothetical protein
MQHAMFGQVQSANYVCDAIMDAGKYVQYMLQQNPVLRSFLAATSHFRHTVETSTPQALRLSWQCCRPTEQQGWGSTWQMQETAARL